MTVKNSLITISIIILNIVGIIFFLFALLFLLAAIFPLFENNYFLALQQVGLSSILFFLWYAIRHSTRKYGKLQKSTYSVTKCVFITLFIVAIITMKCTLFPSDLINLAQQREMALKQIQPAFKRYKQHYQYLPNQPEDLIPEFLAEIPESLNNKNYKKRVYQVRYELSKNKLEAWYYYRDCLGPDCAMSFNLISGEIWHDK